MTFDHALSDFPPLAATLVSIPSAHWQCNCGSLHVHQEACPIISFTVTLHRVAGSGDAAATHEHQPKARQSD